MRGYCRAKDELDSLKLPVLSLEDGEKEIAKLEHELELQLKVQKLMIERVESMRVGVEKLKEAEPAVLAQLEKRVCMAREELDAIDQSRLEYQHSREERQGKKGGKERPAATKIVTATGLTLTAGDDRPDRVFGSSD